MIINTVFDYARKGELESLKKFSKKELLSSDLDGESIAHHAVFNG